MTKRLLALTLLVACLFMLPTITQALPSEQLGVEQMDDKNDVQISVSKSVVHIIGAEGQVMEVISLTGRHVMSVRIDSPAQRIELTNIPKGCYIIKVGKVVRKILI
ncbi:MAG: T9SS type A sorting domain-containing protein [Prevotella sp.]|nr:T9SS type A sorting domain-containing protein [Prevotella sp.]